jgi:hypothetical protein
MEAMMGEAKPIFKKDWLTKMSISKWIKAQPTGSVILKGSFYLNSSSGMMYIFKDPAPEWAESIQPKQQPKRRNNDAGGSVERKPTKVGSKGVRSGKTRVGTKRARQSGRGSRKK